MRSLRAALVALGVLGAAVVATAIAIMASSTHNEDRAIDAAVIGAVMASYIGTGLFAWWRRPDNRVGLLMAAVGFAFFFNALTGSNDPLPFSVGMALSGLYLGVSIHMLLAFPDGRLSSPFQRRLVVGVYALAVGVSSTIVLFTPDCGCPDAADHPRNALMIADAPSVARAAEAVGTLIAVGLIGAIIAALVRRARSVSSSSRRAMAPVVWTGGLQIVVIAVMLVSDVAVESSDAAAIANWLALATFAALPFAFLAGLVRSRYWRAGAVTEVVGALSAGRLRDSLAAALDDPGLELAYWLPERGHYVDADGRPVHVPEPADGGRAVTPVEREGRRIGALVHGAVCDDEELALAVAAAAALAMDNERLEAELRARVAELETSRRRLLTAGLEERRRLERDLHDGAQQRLVALSLQLGLVAANLDRGPGGAATARELLEGARTEARAALEDLRELARGIHPAVLTDRGLGAALESLADRAPLPVDVDAPGDERLPEAIEAAAYFVVAESLTNVAKYAQASHAEVRVGRENGFALVEVRDDGVGGADPSAGTGLRGLADRLAVLDGRLEVESEPGRGTVVRARVPWKAR